MFDTLNADTICAVLMNEKDEQECKKLLKSHEESIKIHNEKLNKLKEMEDLENRKNRYFERIVASQEFAIMYLKMENEKLKKKNRAYGKFTEGLSLLLHSMHDEREKLKNEKSEKLKNEQTGSVSGI